MLIEEGAQRELKQIGAFSVISSVRDIYQDDPQMSLLEASLKNMSSALAIPLEKVWESAYAELKNKLEETSEPEG